MQFTEGKVVIHPHHGPSTVTKVANRNIRGKRIKYVTLEAHADGLVVAVPTDRADEIGLRRVMDKAGVEEIFEVLTDESEPHNRVWSRRFRDYTQRANSGDITVVAGLVRDLIRRNEERPISYGEKGVLKQAFDLLSAEMSLSLERTVEDIEEIVHDTVMEREVPATLVAA